MRFSVMNRLPAVISIWRMELAVQEMWLLTRYELTMILAMNYSQRLLDLLSL